MNEQTMGNIQVRGKDYFRHSSDWYIDKALELAPEDWTYEQVIALRDAIRENYNHSLGYSAEALGGKAPALKRFIKSVALTDPSATIRHLESVLSEADQRKVEKFGDDWWNREK